MSNSKSPDMVQDVAASAAARDLLRARFSCTDVFNTICHDVRAALAVTTGSATELASPDYGALSEMQGQLLAMIQRGNARLARLAANLMQLAELWDGAFEARHSRTDISSLLQRVCTEVQRNEASRVGLSCTAQGDLFAVVDPDVTHHVLANVIGTALAVARNEVSVVASGDAGAIEIVVTDDGPERPTGRDRQPGGGPGKRVSSTALAYSISEALMQAQGGTLSLASPTSEETHSGCRAAFVLPRPKP